MTDINSSVIAGPDKKSALYSGLIDINSSVTTGLGTDSSIYLGLTDKSKPLLGGLTNVHTALADGSSSTTIGALQTLNTTIDTYNKSLLNSLGINKTLTLKDIYPNTSLMQNWATRKFYNILPDDQKNKLDYWVKVIGTIKTQGIKALSVLNKGDLTIAKGLLNNLDPKWTKNITDKTKSIDDVFTALLLGVTKIKDTLINAGTNPDQTKKWLNNVMPFIKAYEEAQSSKIGQYLLKAVSDNNVTGDELSIINKLANKYKTTGDEKYKAYADWLNGFNGEGTWFSPNTIKTGFTNNDKFGNWGDTVREVFPKYTDKSADSFGKTTADGWKWALYASDADLQDKIKEFGNIELNASHVDDYSSGLRTTHLMLNGNDVTSKYEDLYNYFNKLGLNPTFNSDGTLKSLATGGFTGNGSFTDNTGFRVAGVVHNDEWVAPKWMVDSNPAMFGMLESMRINNKSGIDVNVAVDLSLIKETNSILAQEVSIQKKMLRLLQKFDEEGLKCVS